MSPASHECPVRGPLLFWRPTMNGVALIRTEADADPRLVLFGRDGAGKPRASWFDASAADLALKAAELMKLRVLRIETDEHRAVARQVSPGRVFDSGRAFTPFVRADIFGKLVELAHLAQEAGEAAAATGAAASTENGASPAANGFGTASSGGGAPTAPKRPQDWDEIGIGSLVLATTGVEDGWWESIVIGVNGDAFSLKWRDFPRERVFVPPRSELGLLPAVAN